MATDQDLKMRTIWQTHWLAHACIPEGGTWLTPSRMNKSFFPSQFVKGGTQQDCAWGCERTCSHKHSQNTVSAVRAKVSQTQGCARGRASEPQSLKNWPGTVLGGGVAGNPLADWFVPQFLSQGWCSRSSWLWFSFLVRKRFESRDWWH